MVKNLISATAALAFMTVVSGINGASAVEYKTITSCWQPPGTREDGSLLPPSEIIEYQIWYNEEDHGLDWELKWRVPNTVTCVTYTPQGVGGEVCFNGYTLAVNNVDSTKAIKSTLSNTQCIFPVKISPLSPPKPQKFRELIQ